MGWLELGLDIGQRYLQGIVPGGQTGALPGQTPTRGIGGFLQRVVPGGETGYSAQASFTPEAPVFPVQGIPSGDIRTGSVPTPGWSGELQRILPGGESGYYDPLQGAPAPGLGGELERLIPGGQTGYAPTAGYSKHGPIVKTWYTGTAYFGLHVDGYISVLKKNGTIKTYRPHRPVVLSKNPAANVKKITREMKKMKAIHKDLSKLFPTRRRSK